MVTESCEDERSCVEAVPNRLGITLMGEGIRHRRLLCVIQDFCDAWKHPRVLMLLQWGQQSPWCGEFVLYFGENMVLLLAHAFPLLIYLWVQTHYEAELNFYNCFVGTRVILFVEKSDGVGNLDLTHKAWQLLPQRCWCQSEAEARQGWMAAPALSPACQGGNTH